MQYVLKAYFCSDSFKENISDLDLFLDFQPGDNAYYEAQLKYCNFYLELSGVNSDKPKIKKIFDNLIKLGYLKSSYDYGKFLIDEKRYDEAKSIFKKGYDNAQHFCSSNYLYLLLSSTNFSQVLQIITLFFIYEKLCALILFLRS